MSVFVPLPCCFCYFGSVYSLKSSIVKLPVLFFLLRIALAFWGVLPYEFQDFFFYFFEDRHFNFDGSGFQFVDYFGRMVILTIFILLTLEYGGLSIF
jgi:hypothetical protein